MRPCKQQTKPGNSTAGGEAEYVPNHSALVKVLLWCLDLIHMVMATCTEFMWQGLGSGDAVGIAFVRRHQKLLPCPAISKINLLLPKAKPVSNIGSTSVITHLK